MRKEQQDMSEIAICDLCKKKVPIKSWRSADDARFPFRIGRRVVWLAVNLFQGKPDGRRMRRLCGRSHIDLCRACLLKVLVTAIKSLHTS